MKRPAAVIFDCDGVLVDSEVLALEVELETLAALGLSYDLPTFRRRFLGMHDIAFRDALDADRRAVHGLPLPEDFLDVVHERRRAAVDARLTEVRGARAAVAALALPRAVASSTGTAFLERKLRKTDLWSLFAPHAYSADLVPRGKPAPDIFVYAASAVGVAPDSCLAIEDSANGVIAARAAGMRVWGFTGGGHCGPETADALHDAGAERVIATWSEARAHFTAF
ncbi:MAG: HAD-IA family hydrolase [Hyphomonadaceae bacterium]|nr:HAD-IA family hydrolase [Hyphomonadaceae bacterium]